MSSLPHTASIPTPDGDPAILPLVLRDVCFHVGDLPLIKEVSLTLAAGKRTIVIGPNGAGKSLLLRLCHGLVLPSSGDIIWHGADLPQCHQAMVFQRPVMLRRSVHANVDYALKLRNIPRAERALRVDEVLEKTGLRRMADRLARRLSFGEQQKLAIARAWALRPHVMFLDEPTASLDPSATHVIEELVNSIHASGTRIIMTTHDLGQARRMADEVVFMHRGRVLEQSPADVFFKQPENDLAQAFLRGELLWWRRGKGPRHDPKHTR